MANIFQSGSRYRCHPRHPAYDHFLSDRESEPDARPLLSHGHEGVMAWNVPVVCPAPRLTWSQIRCDRVIRLPGSSCFALIEATQFYSRDQSFVRAWTRIFNARNIDAVECPQSRDFSRACNRIGRSGMNPHALLRCPPPSPGCA